jgi:hydrophobic/amphiphilic exporter-1 (mainly G- bacteria), HAE1 family
MVVRLKPFEERTDPKAHVTALMEAVKRETIGMREAVVTPFNLPAIIGLSTTGGFEYQLQDLQGRSLQELAATLRGLIAIANQQPELTNVFSTFTTDTPQLYLRIDREKAQTLGVLPSDIFQALQATLGGYYVNDFNLFGRTWQVVIQSEAVDRNDVEDIYRINMRNASGVMVPIRALADAEIRLGPAYVTRYNNVRAVTINGSPAPGRCDRRHGAHLQVDASRRLCLRVVRHRAPGEGGCRSDGNDPGACDPVRLPVPGRPV